MDMDDVDLSRKRAANLTAVGAPPGTVALHVGCGRGTLALPAAPAGPAIPPCSNHLRIGRALRKLCIQFGPLT